MDSNTTDTLKCFFSIPRVWFGVTILLLAILTALFAPYIAPYSTDEMDLSLRLAGPSIAHPFGCDLNGRDVLTVMFHGARISLYIAFLTVLLSMTVGMGIGLLSGYKLGWIDTIFMRSVDIVMAVPGILVAMVLSALLGSSANNIILAIAATGWTSSARLVRGQVLSLREREFVTASRALGASDVRLVVKHISPQILTPLVVHGTFSLSGVIIVEASLSFLGLGAQDGPPTWGALLGQGRTVLTEAPHLSIVPGLAIMLVVLALNFLGDALRDVLDPRR